MNRYSLENDIDRELSDIRMDERMKQNIRQAVFQSQRKPRHLLKKTAIAAIAAVLVGTTAVAGYQVYNSTQVNGEDLPELDPMEIKKINKLELPLDQYGRFDEKFKNYDEIVAALGIDLLDSDLSRNTPYMSGHIKGDSDIIKITVDNYIAGDMGNYRFFEGENRYFYDKGEIYSSPISLNVVIILSEEQLNIGYNKEYLGYYRFVENYTTEKGYAVNILEDTVEGIPPEDYVSQKIAIFVADGVRYELEGRTTLDTIKYIVESMN